MASGPITSFGLSFMKESVPDLSETPQVLEFVKDWSSYGFTSVLIFLVFGTVLTLVLQSSSATMAITLIMLSMGLHRLLHTLNYQVVYPNAY